MLRRMSLLGLAVLSPIPAHSAKLVAQQPTVTLVGTVLDSTTAAPLPDVAIYLDHTTPSWRTDSAGSFRLDGLETGSHMLVLWKDGYSPRTFRTAITTHHQGEMDVGPVFLARTTGDGISGTISDSMTGLPVFLADVVLNGERLRLTGLDGAFSIPSTQLHPGANLIEARRIGYTPKSVLLPSSAGQFGLSTRIELVPLAVHIPEVIVEGERIVYVFGRLREFEYRRKSGLGYYITRRDIERLQPLYVSDLLWRVPGVMVSPSSIGANNVRFLRGGSCTPVFFVDGIPLNAVPGIETNIDDILVPDDIAGIEVYKGPATIPGRFGMLGGCGIIAIWTRYR